MGSLVIVEPNGLKNGYSSLSYSGKTTIEPIFELENAVDSFGQGVVITVAGLAHAGTDMALGQLVPVAATGVLNTPVAVMNQSLGQAFLSLDRSLQGGFCPFYGQGDAHIRPDDVAGMGIGKQAQVAKTFVRLQVGDVSYPGLVGSCEFCPYQ